MENECTSHIFGSCPIFLPKIIKIGGNLTKFRQKQICLVFLGHGVGLSESLGVNDQTKSFDFVQEDVQKMQKDNQ